MPKISKEEIIISWHFPLMAIRIEGLIFYQKMSPSMANHANNDTKCTPGSRRGAFYFAWGAFSGGGVHVLFEGRLEEVLIP